MVWCGFVGSMIGTVACVPEWHDVCVELGRVGVGDVWLDMGWLESLK